MRILNPKTLKSAKIQFISTNSYAIFSEVPKFVSSNSYVNFLRISEFVSKFVSVPPPLPLLELGMLFEKCEGVAISVKSRTIFR